MFLFFDTETTGKADFKASPGASHQPDLVQLAALLLDGEFRPCAEMSVIVHPGDKAIPVEASNVHGITTERARLVGISPFAALSVFSGLIQVADTLVAHNIDFDLLVIATAFQRYNFSPRPARKIFCTMKAMTPVCRLPGPYGNKWPKLQEAYKHCFGKEFEGAHDAMADVRACAEVFKWLERRAGRGAAEQVNSSKPLPDAINTGSPLATGTTAPGAPFTPIASPALAPVPLS